MLLLDMSGSFQDELHSFESAPHSRFPRTSGLRPASRYSQAAAMYRPQSPPSPPRPTIRVEPEAGLRRTARPPSPEIPTFHPSPEQDRGHMHSRLRERIEALLVDMDAQPMFPLSLSLGDMDGMLDVDEEEVPEHQSSRMIGVEHDRIAPIRPLQRNNLTSADTGTRPTSFPSRSGSGQIEENMHHWDHPRSSLAPRHFMRHSRPYNSRNTVSIDAPRESRPNLPTLRTAIYGTEGGNSKLFDISTQTWLNIETQILKSRYLVE